MVEIQPAVKKETKNVALYALTGYVIMLIVFGALHVAIPHKVPFDYKVILGGLGGCAVTVLNFFLMGLAVQKVAACEDEDQGRTIMKASYTRRTMFQFLWIILAIAVPAFNPIAGLIPLLFPGIGIKLMGIIRKE